MSARGRAARRDANEPAIVRDLRACGVYVKHISGDNAPDLLCYFGGRWQPLGVKRPKGKLTADEKDGVLWPLVTTFDEAARWVGCVKVRAEGGQP